MRSTTVCNSVEGDTIELQCRKFYTHPPRRDPNRGLVYPFKVSIHGFARISKPYETNAPISRKESFVGEGDEIHGEALDGYSLKPIAKAKIEHATSTHKASFVTLRKGYAHIEIGMREHMAKITGGQSD